MRKKNVAIIHYNTPELTEATILSVRKHGGEDYAVYILDNSDVRPFRGNLLSKTDLGDVTIFDNTKGQIIDFEKELERYPERDETVGCEFGCGFGSDKHIMSVQKLWELIPDGFVLMDSDILIKKNIDWMFMYDECACGSISKGSHPRVKDRYLPMLLWINVPMCVAGGARFFDPDRAWALHDFFDDRNYWDTGAAFLDDIRRLKPQCHGRVINILPLMEHYGSGSWLNNSIEGHKEWLEKYKELWK